jgi:hypothetical protein
MLTLSSRKNVLGHATVQNHVLQQVNACYV